MLLVFAGAARSATCSLPVSFSRNAIAVNSPCGLANTSYGFNITPDTVDNCGLGSQSFPEGIVEAGFIDYHPFDGNDGTSREPSWVSLVEAPMHPEYPSGHAILAGAVAAVLKAEIGAGATPPLTTSSPTAKGATRRWATVEAFVREVCDARVYAGIHFRTAVDVGAAMGQRVGELATARLRIGQ